MDKLQRFLLALLCGFVFTAYATASDGTIVLSREGQVPAIVAEDQVTMNLAGDLLARDLTSVTGNAPARAAGLEHCQQVCVVIGRHDSPLVRGLAEQEGLDLSRLDGEWESYERIAIQSRRRPGAQILLIAGSDTRGAIYGVIDLTRELGISAWEWWADVKPARRARIDVSAAGIHSSPPFVQYRGIFLNDEDWGLQPWAARHDPSGDIGPATYARIFELMWRLKANIIWPAMHDSTKPFYQMPGNADTARNYAIVVGTSHAEPMMRNNVREWDQRSRGPFNFFTNRDALVRYWAERVNEVKEYENVYSVGLRGIHDSAMEGARNVEEARQGMTAAIAIQRDILGKTLGKPAPHIPQALTLYKEVLGIYQAGLAVPDDITLVWPDDNYGYLHQLSTPQESRRPGGTGIYYHVSYWGRPHDYLWLGTTHPALIREQLERTSATGSRKIWIVNVGDIKPAEYLTQYFLDLAFDRKEIGRTPRAHLEDWMRTQFGMPHANEIAAIMTEYYDLAWERRPEFMGFSQTEPITPVRQTDYLQSGGGEAESRLERYAALVQRAEAMATQLPRELQDAYFQLVLYPVRSAASLNTRILELDLAAQYAREGRPSANFHASRAQSAQAAIKADTARYSALGEGKWQGMMDAAPRRLPVFDAPLFPTYQRVPRQGCGIAYPFPFSSDAEHVDFIAGRAATRTITLINYAEKALDWKAIGVPHSLSLSHVAGRVDSSNGYEQRIGIRYDGGANAGSFNLQCGKDTVRVSLRTLPDPEPGVPVEDERIVTIPAAQAVSQEGWSVVPGLGSFGAGMRSSLALESMQSSAQSTSVLSYRFSTISQGKATLKLVAVPEHPLSSANKLRIAVSLDGAPFETLDFATHGRSDEWKANVLSNTAVREQVHADVSAGRHTLEIRALDPGFVLDRVELSFDGAPKFYGKPATGSP
jgi:hypothetical protein